MIDSVTYHLAEVHVAPGFTVPALTLLGVLLVMYWLALGRDDVPSSRRRIRRMSVALMLISLPVFAKAMSFVDRDIDPRGYVLAWTAALGFVIVIVVTAFVDMVNNIRLYRIERYEHQYGSAKDLTMMLRRMHDTPPDPDA